jgi:LysM repeat protein
MARLFSRLKMVRQEMKGGSVFLILAVVVFGGVVFLLFRGHASGPQEAAAGAVPPVSSPAENTGETMPSAAVETPSGSAPTSGQRQGLPAEAAQGPAGATSPQNPAIGAAVAEAVNLVRSQPGEIIQARDKLNKLLQAETSPGQRQTIKDEMAKLSKDWLFGPAAFPGDMLCDTYAVKRGDLLDILGRRMKVPHEILMQINNIPRPQALQAGRALKVIHGPFHAKVNRSTFTLDLYLQDMFVRSFKVGLGKPGYETPIGRWRVQEHGKLVKPPWTDPDTGRLYKSTDPDYPLGSRWIGLDGTEGQAKGRTGFAIHGTKEPNQIGTAGSRGCIRMYNDDAVLMYNLLVPLYSQVEVFDIDN